MRMVAGRDPITDGRKVRYTIILVCGMGRLDLPRLGDKWAYSFDVVHDVPTLIERRGGKIKFVQSLEDHFNGGHNDQSNEVSLLCDSSPAS